ncbi:23278_t:CDS:2, partial [Racocetra persica]
EIDISPYPIIFNINKYTDVFLNGIGILRWLDFILQNPEISILSVLKKIDKILFDTSPSNDRIKKDVHSRPSTLHQ